MAESGRQSLTEKAQAAIVPDSQKSGTDKFTDNMKGKADSAASTAEPESHKSTTQKVGDTFSSNSNENDQSLLDKTKNAVGLGGNKNT